MSKFASLIKAAKTDEQPLSEAEPQERTAKPSRKKPTATAKSPTAAKLSRKKPAGTARPPAALESKAKPQVEKPVGRSRDPDYTKAMMYIPLSLHEDVKRLLIGSGMNYSQLCEDLLNGWVKKNS